MNKIHIKRLEKLATFLDGLPREKFDFRYVVAGEEHPRKELDCGSTACAIGWCPVVFPRLVTYRNPRGFSLNDFEVVPRDQKNVDISFHATGEVLFGLTPIETNGLFDNYCQEPLGLPNLKADATAKAVAKNIRRFIKMKAKP